MIFTTRIRAAFIATLLVLIVGGLGMRGAMYALGVYIEKLPVPLRRDLATIPTTLGPWKRVGADRVESAEMVKELGTDFYLTRTYARTDGSGAQIQLHLAYYTGMIDAVPHIPERCMYAAGLNPMRAAEVVDLGVKYTGDNLSQGPVNRSTGLPYGFAMVENPMTRELERVAMPLGDLGLTLAAFQNPKEPQVEVDIGYFFIANGGLSSGTMGVRKLAFNLTEKYAYYCKVQISMAYPVGKTAPTELFRKDAVEFLSLLIPNLMRALPDWPAIEAKEIAEAQRTKS